MAVDETLFICKDNAADFADCLVEAHARAQGSAFYA